MESKDKTTQAIDFRVQQVDEGYKKKEGRLPSS